MLSCSDPKRPQSYESQILIVGPENVGKSTLFELIKEACRQKNQYKNVSVMSGIQFEPCFKKNDIMQICPAIIDEKSCYIIDTPPKVEYYLKNWISQDSGFLPIRTVIILVVDGDYLSNPIKKNNLSLFMESLLMHIDESGFFFGQKIPMCIVNNLKRNLDAFDPLPVLNIEKLSSVFDHIEVHNIDMFDILENVTCANFILDWLSKHA